MKRSFLGPVLLNRVRPGLVGELCQLLFGARVDPVEDDGRLCRVEGIRVVDGLVHKLLPVQTTARTQSHSYSLTKEEMYANLNCRETNNGQKTWQFKFHPKVLDSFKASRFLPL